MLPYMSRSVLTTTRSKSLGPAPRVWRSASGGPGHVCYLHRAHVHARLPGEAAQVCHIVSRPLPPPLPSPPLPRSTFPYLLPWPEVVPGRWPVAHVLLIVPHGYANSCNAFKVHLVSARARPLPTAALTNRVHVPLDLSSHCNIGTGPSAAIMRVQGSARCRVQTTFGRVRSLGQASCTSPEER